MAKQSLKINAVLNVIKQLCQVIFPLISIPYISRVLQPTSYGKYNYGYSIISYFVLIAALGISTYSVREGVAYRDDKNAFGKFASEVFSINVFSTALSYSLLGIALLIPDLEPYRKLILIQSLIIVLTTLGTDWVNTIYEDFLYITIRYVIFQIISIALMFWLVKTPEDYLIYAAIVVCSSAGANILNIFHVRRYARIHFTFDIDWKRHFPPIMLFFANILAITIYVNSDITMIGAYKGDDAVGIYTVASKVYSIVKQVLNAVIVVAVPRLSLLIKENNTELFDLLATKIKKTLLMIILPATVGVCLLSSEFVKIVGGELYENADSPLFILSIAIIFSLMATYYTCCVMVPLKMEKYVLFSTIVSAAVNVLLNFILIPLFSYNGAAITTVISECLVFLLGWHFSNKHISDKVDIGFILKVLAGCCIIVVSCLIVKQFGFGTILTSALAVTVSTLLYFLVEYIVRNDFLLVETKSFVCSILNKLRR